MYVVPRSDMSMSDPMPFSQHWEVRVPVSIQDIGDLGAAIQSNYTSFKPGDLVHVCAFDNRKWERLAETASFRIVSCDNRKIETVQVSDTIKIPAPTSSLVQIDGSKLLVVNIGKAFEVRDERGDTLEVFVSKEQADEYISSHTPKVIETKNKEPEQSSYELKRGFQGKYKVCNATGEVLKECKNKAEAEAWVEEQQAPQAKVA